jgi:hypothetical protein
MSELAVTGGATNATLMFVAAGGVLLAAVVAGLLSGAQHRLD